MVPQFVPIFHVLVLAGLNLSNQWGQRLSGCKAMSPEHPIAIQVRQHDGHLAPSRDQNLQALVTTHTTIAMSKVSQYNQCNRACCHQWKSMSLWCLDECMLWKAGTYQIFSTHHETDPCWLMCKGPAGIRPCCQLLQGLHWHPGSRSKEHHQ